MLAFFVLRRRLKRLPLPPKRSALPRLLLRLVLAILQFLRSAWLPGVVLAGSIGPLTSESVATRAQAEAAIGGLPSHSLLCILRGHPLPCWVFAVPPVSRHRVLRGKPQLWTEVVALIPQSATKDAHEPFPLGVVGALHLVSPCNIIIALAGHDSVSLLCRPWHSPSLPDFCHGNIYIVHLGMLWCTVRTPCQSRWRVG